MGNPIKSISPSYHDRRAYRLAALACLGGVALGAGLWTTRRQPTGRHGVPRGGMNSILRQKGMNSDPRRGDAKRPIASAAAATAGREDDTPHAPAGVRGFCGDCHATPRPDRVPREAWGTAIGQGYRRYKESGRQDLIVPAFADIAAYYERHAKPMAELHPPHCPPVDHRTLRFERTEIVAPGGTRDPFIAGLAATRASNRLGSPQIIFSDMRHGYVAATGPRWSSMPLEICDRQASPSYLQPCDLDCDGRIDLLVADLGAFPPADHQLGKVVWLRALGEGDYQRIDLAAGLGRVADVQPGDFDKDGDLDLVVAEFGWHETGRILLLENRATDDSPEFARHVVDLRHGAIHVPVADLNQDGHLDFVALISQEHEVIEAFLGRGDNQFDRRTIFAAEDPSYASSGIELVDLDGDGDLDVLYVNGDCFDAAYLKPYHSVQWLENTGGYPYEHHLLARMPGASRALAGDLDGDGDLDVVAAALLPPNVLREHGAENFDSLVWFEQTAPGRFEQHPLEKSLCQHACLELGDFDADGDFDVAVGNAVFEPPPRGYEPAALTIWWNQRISSSVEKGKKMEGKKIGREQRATKQTERESQNAK